MIDWNRKSADAALQFPAADGISHHYSHALDYLVYAYLQRGDDEQALALLEEISAKDDPFQGTFISAFHLAAIPARYAVERRAWNEALALTPGRPDSVAWEQFLVGGVHSAGLPEAWEPYTWVMRTKRRGRSAAWTRCGMRPALRANRDSPTTLKSTASFWLPGVLTSRERASWHWTWPVRLCSSRGGPKNIRSHRELCGQPRRRLVICCLTLGVPARHSQPTKAHW